MLTIDYDPTRYPQVEVTSCPVCEALDIVARYPLRDRYGFQATLAECHCGLFFLNPRLTAAAYDEFYRYWYRPLVATIRRQPLSLDEMEQIQHGYAANLAGWLAPYVTGPVRHLLDIGGSTGVVAKAVGGRFLATESTVIDPSPEELKRAHQRGLKTRCGLAESAHYPDSDLILLCQTVDHLLQPRQVLQRIKGALRPGGLFYVDILIFPGMTKQVSQIVKLDHPYYFTVATMRRLLQSVGFETVAERTNQTKTKQGFLCRASSPP